MLNRKIFQSRYFILIITSIVLLVPFIKFFKNDEFGNKSSSASDISLVWKIIEVNDRQPTYKLMMYDGYKFPLERNRAQTKLFTQLKLCQTCQTDSNTTVVDIGASLGEFSLYAAACGCRVFTFEIDPRKTESIEKSIKLNSFESRIHLIRKAVTDIQGNETLFFSRNTSSQTTNQFHLDKTQIYSAETIFLNHFDLFPSSIFLLRVDVQGYELHVFRSMEKYFRKHQIKHGLFEYTSWGTENPVQKDIFHYMMHILGAKSFYALHPRDYSIYGPLSEQDIQQFYSNHLDKHLQRDIYVSFQDQNLNPDATPYQFESSF